MPVSKNGTLRSMLNRLDKPMGEPCAQNIIFQLINGAKELNNKNIIHFDLKPECILIQNENYIISDLDHAQFFNEHKQSFNF